MLLEHVLAPPLEGAQHDLLRKSAPILVATPWTPTNLVWCNEGRKRVVVLRALLVWRHLKIVPGQLRRSVRTLLRWRHSRQRHAGRPVLVVMLVGPVMLRVFERHVFGWSMSILHLRITRRRRGLMYPFDAMKIHN